MSYEQSEQSERSEPGDPAQGLFPVNGNPNGIRVESIGQRTASEIVFMVPADLAASEYLLHVRNRSNEDHIQMGTLAQPLTGPG